jgi:hypothetical protein
MVPDQVNSPVDGQLFDGLKTLRPQGTSCFKSNHGDVRRVGGAEEEINEYR